MASLTTSMPRWPTLSAPKGGRSTCSSAAATSRCGRACCVRLVVVCTEWLPVSVCVCGCCLCVWDVAAGGGCARAMPRCDGHARPETAQHPTPNHTAPHSTSHHTAPHTPHQAVRNLDDLETMSCPVKYRHIMTFWKYYSGQAVAPVPTLFSECDAVLCAAAAAAAACRTVQHV
jgi:hypothetical protein